MNDVEIVNKQITNKKEILDKILSMINSISIIDEDTIGITLDKNFVIYNNKSSLFISKEYQVNIAKQIHLNPEINIRNFYNNPDKLESLLNEANKKAKMIEHNHKTCNH